MRHAHLGAGNFLAWGALATSILFTLAIFIFEDFTRFFVHYLYHKVPLLWRFHAIHHSATVMTPITLYRIHIVKMAINSCRSLLVIGGLSGVFIYAFNSPVGLIQVLGFSIFTMLFIPGGGKSTPQQCLGRLWLPRALVYVQPSTRSTTAPQPSIRIPTMV